MRPFRLYFRFNVPREKKVLQNFRDKYYGLAIDAHVLETFPKDFPTFIDILKKPFFIDPVLYKFSYPTLYQHRESKWFERLTRLYGIEGLLQSGELLTSAALENSASEVVPKIVGYQKERINMGLKQLRGLMAFLGEEFVQPVQPEFILAPYIMPNDERGFEVNSKMALQARQLSRDIPMYSVLACDRDFLLLDKFKELALEALQKVKSDGVALWFGNFREWYEEEEVLRITIEFLGKIRKMSGERPIINMFGGFFSLGLASLGYLDAVVQGIGLAEFRDPEAEAGPVPNRYYVPKLHVMVAPEVAADLVSIDPELFGCTCQVCKAGSDPAALPTPRLIEHSMLCRLLEAQEITNFDKALQSLKETAESIEKLAQSRFPRQKVIPFSNRLKRWANVLEEAKKHADLVGYNEGG